MKSFRCPKLYQVFLWFRSIAVGLAVFPLVSIGRLSELLGQVRIVGWILEILAVALILATYFIVAMVFFPVGFLISERYGLAPNESSSCVDITICLLVYLTTQSLHIYAVIFLAEALL